MKKLGIYVLMLAMMMAVTFVGCEKDPDPDPIDPAAPVVTINGGTIITIDIRDLSALAVPVSVTSADADLTSIKVSIQVDDNTPVLLGEPITDFGETPKVWAKTYTIADINIGIFEGLDPDMALTFIVEANIADKQTTEKADVQIIGWPDLSGENDLRWYRLGSNITGLDEFGLKWDKSLKDIHAQIIKNGASKMVILSIENWNTFTYKEEVAAAIKAATPIDVYTGINVSNPKIEAGMNVLGVEYNNVYYIINLTSVTSKLVGDQGTETIVTGKYKK